MAVASRKDTEKIRSVLERPHGTSGSKTWVEGFKEKNQNFNINGMMLRLPQLVMQWDVLVSGQRQKKDFLQSFFLNFIFLLSLTRCAELGVWWLKRERARGRWVVQLHIKQCTLGL